MLPFQGEEFYHQPKALPWARYNWLIAPKNINYTAVKVPIPNYLYKKIEVYEMTGVATKTSTVPIFDFFIFHIIIDH